MTCLAIRLCSFCSGCGTSCIYSSSNIVKFLPIEAIKRLSKVIDRIRECVILCSSPTKHPHLYEILEHLDAICRHIRMAVPLSEALTMPRRCIEFLDELALVVARGILCSDKDRIEHVLKTVATSGTENVWLYVVYEDPKSIELALNVLEYASRLGIRIRVGEKLYISMNHVDVRSELMRMGIDVGLPYGEVYGYKASIAMVNGYPITVLFKDPYSCSSIYLDYDGKLYRCYRVKTIGIDLAKDIVDPLEVRRIMSMKCPEMKDMLPVISIGIKVRDTYIPSDVLQLLELIDFVRSVRKACAVLGSSASTCVEKIRKVEKSLGVKLVQSFRGGKEGGYTILTTEGRAIVEMYRRIRNAVAQGLISNGFEDVVLS